MEQTKDLSYFNGIPAAPNGPTELWILKDKKRKPILFFRLVLKISMEMNGTTVKLFWFHEQKLDKVNDFKPVANKEKWNRE